MTSLSEFQMLKFLKRIIIIAIIYAVLYMDFVFSLDLLL